MQPTPQEQKIFQHNYKMFMRWPASYRQQCFSKTDGGMFAPVQLDFDRQKPR